MQNLSIEIVIENGETNSNFLGVLLEILISMESVIGLGQKQQCDSVLIDRVPGRLENLENEIGHGKVMEHGKFAKSHGIL